MLRKLCVRFDVLRWGLPVAVNVTTPMHRVRVVVVSVLCWHVFYFSALCDPGRGEFFPTNKM